MMKARLRFVFLLLLVSSAASAQDARERAFIARAKQFFDLLEARKYDECMPLFDSSLVKVLSVEKMKQNWEPMRTAMGKLIKQEGEVFEDKKSYVIVLIGAKYEKEEMALRVAFNPQMKIVGFFKSKPLQHSTYQLPAYARPDQTIEKRVTVATDTFKLPGILLLPNGVAHPPVVVMVAGSGPNDRDESIGENKPFRDIAYGLAAAGIATLRYDKRTLTYGATYVSPSATLTPDEEVVADALSALKMARANPDLDPKRVFLLGHSLGAMMAPRIAERDKQVAGVIMLAAPARPFQDVIVDQVEFLGPQQMTKERAEEQLKAVREMAKRITDRAYSDSTSARQLLGMSPAYWDYLRDYDQVKTALAIPQPILYLRGGKDYQIPEKDFSIWQIKLGAKQNAELKLFGPLYHLFMLGKGTFTDYDVPGNVTEGVISTITEWIKRH